MWENDSVTLRGHLSLSKRVCITNCLQKVNYFQTMKEIINTKVKQSDCYTPSNNS